MSDDIRKAGEYTIIQSIHIGDKEVVVGENTAVPEARYLVAYCASDGIMELYSEGLVSACYAEIMQIFSERVAEQAKQALEHYKGCQEIESNLTPLGAEECDPISHADNIEGKVVVIKAGVLRREYQMPTHQLKLCTGGFGSHGNARGSACYCTDLYSGESSRFERADILGTVKEDNLPDWAKQGLADIRRQQAERKKEDAR